MSNATQTWSPDLQAAVLVGWELRSQCKPWGYESDCALKITALTRVASLGMLCVLGGGQEEESGQRELCLAMR